MELVLLERRFEHPVTFEQIQSLEDSGARCLTAHNVRFVKTFLSRDRRRMLCLYEAPDAEAVRLAENQARAPFLRAWSCTKLQKEDPIGLPSSGFENVIVEREFPKPVSVEFVMDAYRTKVWCFQTYAIEHVETYLAKDGLRMVCLFQSPDAESVRMANQLAEAPFTEVWTANLHIAE